MSRQAVDDFRQVAVMKKRLRWLSIAYNAVPSFEHGAKLSKLNVLNAAHNGLESLAGLSGMYNLNALIVSHNKLEGEVYIRLKRLDTLIISHNALTALRGLPAMPNLEKVSASHNSIEVLPLFEGNPLLKEVRLGHNAISSLPPECFVANPFLRILELSNNNLDEKAIDTLLVAILPNLKLIETLNVRGNPGMEARDQAEFVAAAAAAAPSLRVVNGVKTQTAEVSKKLVPKRRRRLHMFGHRDAQAKEMENIFSNNFKRPRESDDDDDDQPSGGEGGDVSDGDDDDNFIPLAKRHKSLRDGKDKEKAKGKDKAKGKKKGKDKGKKKGKDKARRKEEEIRNLAASFDRALLDRHEKEGKKGEDAGVKDPSITGVASVVVGGGKGKVSLEDALSALSKNDDAEFGVGGGW